MEPTKQNKSKSRCAKDNWATVVAAESVSVPTWHVCRGSEPVGKAWPCSMRCCSRSASGSGPWPRGSGSCHSRGYAMRGKPQRQEELTWLRRDSLLCYTKKHLFTILCLYSSEASCTAVSQALEPLAYTLLTSSIQYLQSRRRTWKTVVICAETGFYFICDGSRVPLCSSRHLLCWSSKGHVVLLWRDRPSCQVKFNWCVSH